MKKLLLILCLLSGTFHFVATAQQNPEIWGATGAGGNLFGTIFKLDENGNNREVVFEFQGVTVVAPPQFLEGSGNWLYGVGLGGGEYSEGGLFRYNYVSKTFEKLYDFGGGEQYPLESPGGMLVWALNGNIIGTTKYGGTGGFGVIFEFDTATRLLHRRVEFDTAVNGQLTVDGLTYGPGGLLYGAGHKMKNYKNYKSVIFSYDPLSGNYSEMYTAPDSSLGIAVLGKLLYASDGKFYGTTRNGGLYDKGVIFSFDPSDTTWEVKHHFNDTLGRFPVGHLIEAGSSGRCFGVTPWGSGNQGVLYEYDIRRDSFICHHKFNGTSGALPLEMNLMQAANGKIYGLTHQGGNNSLGVLFEFDTAGNQYKVLYNFHYGNAGGKPRSTLMQAFNGMLYGTTSWGTSSNNGSIFSYNLTNKQVVPEKYILDRSQGYNTIGRLLHHSNGKLYGTANGGYLRGDLIYSLDPVTKVYRVEYEMAGSKEGYKPTGHLVEWNNGLIYGLTQQGGKNNGGVIFSFNPSNKSYTVLHSLEDAVTGSEPMGGFAGSVTGKLYALTSRGGNKESLGGTIISLKPSTNELSVIHHFDRDISVGGWPIGTLENDVNGILYGTTQAGGDDDCGGIFKLNPFNDKFEAVHECDRQGELGRPDIAFTKGPGGLLYCGTDGNGGIAFSLDPSNDKIENLEYAHWDSLGASPYGRMLWASNNKLYGTTREGGKYEGGTIFELDVVGKKLTKKYDLDADTGWKPWTSLIELYGLGLSVEEALDEGNNLEIFPNPVSSVLNLSHGGAPQNSKIRIYNMASCIVLEKEIYINGEITLDVSQLPSGMYIITMTTGEGVMRGKFVKK